jgi:dihydroorotate dehydrogenase
MHALASLQLKRPYLNSSGMLGFSPRKQLPCLSGMGAFITNPISFHRRSVARDRTLLQFPGGVLIHTGMPNPGFATCIKKYSPLWKRSPLPVWVHLEGGDAAEMQHMSQVLEECEGVTALEVDLARVKDAHAWRDVLNACSSKLLLAVQVGSASMEDEKIALLKERDVCAISLAPARGTMPDPNGQLVSGRLYGAAFFPQTLKAIQQLVLSGIPVIAAGGIFDLAQADLCLQAGAVAVKFDLALWKGDPFQEIGSER